MTSALPEPTPTDPKAARGRRMNRSRAIAAGTSVGALVALTAGVAVANPGAHSSPPTAAASRSNPSGSNSSGSSSSSSDRSQRSDDGGGGGDSGWLGPDDSGNVDPNSGWASAPQAPSGSFDPGIGGGNTSSGGS